ncbi:MAG: hypothetical protein ABIH17_09700 [Pseudomonadota bacterium]
MARQPSLTHLTEVGSMTDAMGVYVSAMVFQKGLGLARVLLFAFLMREVRAQYALWGLGMMVFTMAGRLLHAGANQGIERYVSYYEARGRLEAFYRRIRWCIVALVAVTGAMAFAASDPVTRCFIASRGDIGVTTYNQQLHVCWFALANAVVISLYQCLLAVMAGMRTYRLLSAMEVLFSILLTVLGAAALIVQRSAVAMLLAHLGAVSVSATVGTLLLRLAVGRSAAHQADIRARTGDESSGGAAGACMQVLGFGAMAMAAALVWSAAQFVGFHITNRDLGKDAAAPFTLMMQLAQPVLFIANAAWAVLFSHAARRWEDRDRHGAVSQLQTAYKAIAMGTMTLTVALYAASGLWMRLLPHQYADGQPLLGGLFLLFQAMTQLSLLTMLAKLHEKPMVTGVVALGAVALNVILAMLWMDSGGAEAISWAGGVGMYAGGGGLAAAYLLISRARMQVSTYFVLAAPILLVLPVWLPMWVMAAAWAAVLAVAVATPWLFDQRQKHVIMAALKRLAGNVRRAISWR